MPRVFRAAAVAVLLCAALTPVAEAHQGDPNFRSIPSGVMPAVAGVRVEAVNYDDALQLTNRSDRTVVIEGYDGEPYARLLPDGTVQVNRRSPATYLNDERYGGSPVPASASAEAEPQWRTVDRTGRLSWHDHRMHWMGSGRPPAVRDAGTRTKVFDYEIPLRVDGRPATIAGTLFWVGEPGGGMPAWAIVALLALAAAAVALVLIVRRRRRPPDAPSPVADAPGEAW